MSNRFNIRVRFDFMFNYVGVNAYHFFVGPRENIMKFIEHSGFSWNLFKWTIIFDHDVFHNDRFHRGVNTHCGGYASQIFLLKNVSGWRTEFCFSTIKIVTISSFGIRQSGYKWWVMLHGFPSTFKSYHCLNNTISKGITIPKESMEGGDPVT